MTNEIKNENDIVETPQGVEEAMHDAPKKGSGKAEPMVKADGEVQDGGPAVVSPDAKSSPTDHAKKSEKRFFSAYERCRCTRANGKSERRSGRRVRTRNS
mgnify:CR=1 FL=1